MRMKTIENLDTGYQDIKINLNGTKSINVTKTKDNTDTIHTMPIKDELVGNYKQKINLIIDKFIHEWGGDVGNYARYLQSAIDNPRNFIINAYTTFALEKNVSKSNVDRLCLHDLRKINAYRMCDSEWNNPFDVLSRTQLKNLNDLLVSKGFKPLALPPIKQVQSELKLVESCNLPF